MGADEFLAYQEGTDADESFRAAVANAQWEYGSGGYTGSIAEKAGEGFVIVSAEPVDLGEAGKMAFSVLRGDDERWAEIRDKWGRAGGIAVKGGRREHEVKIPAVPGGHADLDAAVAAAVSGVLVPGEHVVYGTSGSYRTAGVRVLGGTVTVPTEGAQVHTGWLWIGIAPS
ncbi:hypothetical protein L3Q65_01140 (plasmid) [Amycolatopsis sp. FU40]|uniref:hypothetical protein n=1 Tax=Amycolatopsis sp. FU40 TaxID=2914159 RepID=UPI001F31F14F|nr:hypothetical protein [Amycolatopsis sp. FU40]UKD50930.1 hypothetical protein L3Q65_01140 [Amycolatopsis sp. FU40]